MQGFIMVHSIKIQFHEGYMMDSQQKKYASRGVVNCQLSMR